MALWIFTETLRYLLNWLCLVNMTSAEVQINTGLNDVAQG